MAGQLASGGHGVALGYSQEMSDELVSELKRSPLDKKSGHGLSIIAEDADVLSFPDCFLDVVHRGAALQSVPGAKAAMQEMYRVLKPGGKLYTILHADTEFGATSISVDVERLRPAYATVRSTGSRHQTINKAAISQ